MRDIFINFTNHPSEEWDGKQKRAANQYGDIMDIPFPQVDSTGDEVYVQKLSDMYVEKITSCQPQAVLCQGEFTAAYQVIRKLKERGVIVLAACSERKVIEENGMKLVQFEFERFREYG